jgi:hypothetical protein
LYAKCLVGKGSDQYENTEAIVDRDVIFTDSPLTLSNDHFAQHPEIAYFGLNDIAVLHVLWVFRELRAFYRRCCEECLRWRLLLARDDVEWPRGRPRLIHAA